MRKQTLPLLIALSGFLSTINAQVGVNTTTPTSTLDVTAKNATGTTTNVDGLLVPRVDRQRAQSMISVPTSTLIYVNSIATGALAGSAINIDATGYYFFSGGVWVKLMTPAAASVNIYNSDGSLTGNRIVTQAANTLAFNGTATNAFSVDGTTLSVDAANDRVGLGTTTPETKLHVVSTTAGAGRYNLIDAPAGIGEVPLVVLRNTSPLAANNTSYLGFSSSNASGGASWGIGSQQNTATAIDNNFQIAYSNGGFFQKFFNILPSGNTGIGTTTPQKRLHVNGSLQVTNELNVGGNATTAGSAGTIGQILTSGGAGAAPNWQNASAASVNIYNTDGSLTGNRIVTQAANTLAFTSTATNGFSVDGTTFSVDAANDRIGLGTATPQKALHVNGDLQVTNELNVGGNATTAGSAGTTGQILTSGGAGVAPTWQTAASSVNIYNANGSLTGNRIVTQAANTLAFTGTATNAFSVDGNTLSVDAANDRVGLGTTTPETKLHVVSTTAGAGRYNLIDAPASIGEVPLIVLRNTSPLAANNTSYLGFSSSNASGGASWGVGSQQNSATAIDNNFQIAYSNGGGFQKFFNILPSGNTGIGTTTPQKKLHVNGDLQITSELNVGGNATTAGSAGTTGQILTSGGSGAAPTWQTAAPSVNIYNADGSLTGNRTVTQAANTLAFTGTVTNAFSVDGTTLSVDAANNRLGLGTATPQKALHVNGDLQVTNELNVGGNATTAGSAGTLGQMLTSGGVGAAPSWQNVPANVNIYNADGSLTGNRIVTQAANTLAFNGTATNAFSVDGTTLSVDAANDRVGIGTTAPAVKLDVAQAIGTGEATQLRIINTSPIAVNNTAYLGFNSYGGGGATWGMGAIQNSTSATDNNFHIMYSNGALFNKFFTIRPNNGFVGILTTTPQRALHVNGGLQVTNELNVGGNATTAGSAGTIGQILTSGGAGAAPSWQNASAASVNIYNTDGSLTGNRIVTQAANTLAFTSTATNGFSVDGTTFSIDAANNRIGLGTAAPTAKLEVASGTANVSGVKLTNLTSASPIGTGQALGVDASGNIITVANPSPTGVSVNSVAVTSGGAFDVNDLTHTVVTGTPQTISVPAGGKALFVNFMLGIDYVTTPAGGGQAFYEARLYIDGAPSDCYIIVQELAVGGSAQFSMSTVKFMAAGSHNIDVRMIRSFNNGTTSGANMNCSPSEAMLTKMQVLIYNN